MTFITVTENILITPAFNFTLHNKPTLEIGNNGHTTLTLNCNAHQYIELPDSGVPCLENLSSCDKGFTFKLTLMFTDLNSAEKTYILSSGGDVAFNSGMGIYVHNYQLIYGVKKGFYHWVGSYNMSNSLKLNTWYNYEISWSLKSGVSVIIDGIEVIHVTAWSPSPGVEKTNPVLIGKTTGANTTTCMKIRDLFTWTASRDILVDHGVLPG